MKIEIFFHISLFLKLNFMVLQNWIYPKTNFQLYHMPLPVCNTGIFFAMCW